MFYIEKDLDWLVNAAADLVADIESYLGKVAEFQRRYGQ